MLPVYMHCGMNLRSSNTTSMMYSSLRFPYSLIHSVVHLERTVRGNLYANTMMEYSSYCHFSDPFLVEYMLF